MGTCCRIFTIGLVLVIAYVGYKINKYHNDVPPIPNISRTKYWGPGNEPEKLDEKISQFTITMDPEMIKDLKSRLNRTRYTEPLEGTAFNYGFRHTELKKVVNFWQNEYNFKERENHFNKYRHYTTNIQGLNIHYIHVRPRLPRTMKLFPLLMVHGWPGSVMEFQKIIPLLTTPQEGNDFAFELVIPSLPGFGWSQAASKPGMGAAEMAVVLGNLMNRLGYEKYFIQGGDWGSIIMSMMSILYPNNVIGYHSNMPMAGSTFTDWKYYVGALFPSWFIDEKFAHRVFPIKKILYNTILESGYFHIQATKPDSLGAGLGDSPAGLAAWILEKFSMGTNMMNRDLEDGGLTDKFTYTELIDNLMVYWMTNSATTAARIYSESFNIKHFAEQWERIPSFVPMAAARFPHEINYFTDDQLRGKYPNLVQTTDMPQGGHFAAMEETQLLADDIISAVKLFNKFHLNKNGARDDL